MSDANAAAPGVPPWLAWRSIAAAVVRSRCAAAAIAVVVAVYLVLAMVWCLFASLGLCRNARAACGDGCTLVAVADEVSRLAMGSLVVLIIVTLVVAVASICVVACDPEAEKVIMESGSVNLLHLSEILNSEYTSSIPSILTLLAVEENTPCPKSPEKSTNPRSKRYRTSHLLLTCASFCFIPIKQCNFPRCIGFGGAYVQSKLSNILHANELAGDLRYVFLHLMLDYDMVWPDNLNGDPL